MRKILWSLFEVFETVAIAVVAVILVRSFIAQPFLVNGSSMEPSFYDGDYLLVDELSYQFREPQRGEIVVFKNPVDHNSYYIKRVIGLPGEQVIIEGSEITVHTNNGETRRLDEKYIMNPRSTVRHEVVLADEEYFVMGDNRSFSFDSRSWGPLDRDEIVGLVRLRLWPVNHAMAIAAPTYSN